MRRKHRCITGPDQLEDRRLLSLAVGSAPFPLPLNTHPAVVATATPAPGLLTGGNARVATQTNSLMAAAVGSFLSEKTALSHASGAIVSTTLSMSGNPRVYYLGDDGQIHELALWGGSWHHLVVTTAAGGPRAAAGTALTSTTYNGDPRVYYESDDGQIHELAFYGGSWHHLVVTTAAGGPRAAAGTALTSTTYKGDPRVYYVGGDNQIHELALWGDNKWHHLVVTTAAGGPPAEPYTPLTSTTYKGDPRVYYVGGDNQIHELALWGDNKWHHLAVSTAAGGPSVVSGTALTSTTYNGDPRVYYESGDGQIHELGLWGDNKWHHLVVTTAAGGPDVAFGRALSSTTYNGDPRVYYEGGDGSIHELALWGGKWHHLALTPAGHGSFEDVAFQSGLTSTTYNGNPSVYYVGSWDYQIRQLAFYGGKWHHLVVSDSTPEPSPNAVTSPNWSGYVTETNLQNPQANSVTYVAGSWIVPTVTGPSSGTTYSCVWVGIDGLNGSTVEQIGTEQDMVNGSPVYRAWWEMFSSGIGQPQQFTTMTLLPGDSISASVQFITSGPHAGQFYLSIVDNSRVNDSFSTYQRL